MRCFLIGRAVLFSMLAPLTSAHAATLDCDSPDNQGSKTLFTLNTDTGEFHHRHSRATRVEVNATPDAFMFTFDATDPIERCTITISRISGQWFSTCGGKGWCTVGQRKF